MQLTTCKIVCDSDEHPIIFIDKNYKIIYYNKSCYNLFKIRNEKLIGSNIKNILNSQYVNFINNLKGNDDILDSVSNESRSMYVRKIIRNNRCQGYLLFFENNKGEHENLKSSFINMEKEILNYEKQEISSEIIKNRHVISQEKMKQNEDMKEISEKSNGIINLSLLSFMMFLARQLHN